MAMLYVEASHQGYLQGPDAMFCLRAGYGGGLRRNVVLRLSYSVRWRRAKKAQILGCELPRHVDGRQSGHPTKNTFRRLAGRMPGQ